MKRLALLSVTLIGLIGCASGQDGLSRLQADIVSDYPTVSHISAEALQKMEDVVLLDIREADEFAVSHIPGAIRIAPDARDDAWLTQIGDLSGKHVVAYCSVGRRSSIFARTQQETLVAQGALSVSNLEHGIFGWHGTHRPLEDAGGKTDVVHPYNDIWKRYVPRSEKARYSPE